MEEEGVPTAQLMTSEIITVTPGTLVEDAVQTLLEEDIGSLVVVDGDNRLVGVVTSNDFLEVISNSELEAGATVEQYMTDQVITISPGDSIQTAAARMITNGISHLPVEDPDEGITGMITTTDITAYAVSHA